MTKKPKSTPIAASLLVELLAEKHAKDVFVAECKNGGTWSPGPDGILRLDAWALRKTWCPWTTIGYEIKVGRADFERDQKWLGYLPYCHQFYLVSPPGLVKGVDLPKGVGLIWCSANGSRLYTKIKAARREPDRDKLTQLMSYVLMSRCRVVANMHEAARTKEPDVDRSTMYRAWVESAEADQKLAHFIRGHVKKCVAGAVAAHRDAQRLGKQAERFAKQLARLGITWDVAEQNWKHQNKVEREIDQLDRGLGEHTRVHLRAAANAMVRALDELKRTDEQ